MMKLDGIAAFVATAEAGSISAAARRLGNAKSVVSERLAELERSLGTRLIQRTTRKLSLTEDGHTFLARAQRILFEAGEAAPRCATGRPACRVAPPSPPPPRLPRTGCVARAPERCGRPRSATACAWYAGSAACRAPDRVQPTAR